MQYFSILIILLFSCNSSDTDIVRDSKIIKELKEQYQISRPNDLVNYLVYNDTFYTLILSKEKFVLNTASEAVEILKKNKVTQQDTTYLLIDRTRISDSIYKITYKLLTNDINKLQVLTMHDIYQLPY